MTAMKTRRYSLVGNLYTFNWSDVHVAPGVFDWTIIDQYLTRVAASGKRAAIGISTYNARCCGGINATPAWVWQNDPRRGHYRFLYHLADRRLP
ncbi:MAG: hypothetical protein HZY76_03840 [Anaerolineae bacterium]|nr:MAG: hypothetical protein HZY76_03840 [Anaerolineae bacterium]